MIQQQRLDFSKPVTGKDLDFRNYKKKLKYWETVLKENRIGKGNREAILGLKDPTFYARSFFVDDKNKPLVLTAYQDAIGNCTHDFSSNNPNRYVLFRASNQIGKSMLLSILALQHALNEENVNVVMVSRSLPQSQFLLAQIKWALNNSSFSDTWRESLGETKNTTVLTFQRNEGKIVNRIICAPSGEGLLGYPVHYLFLDEADFYEDGQRFFWKVAFPRTKKTKGQIILFSNPNPDISRNASILWELWNRDMFKRKFHFNFLDAPWNTVEEFEHDKRNSPHHIFISTHMGDFPQEGGAFFSHKEIQDMLKREWHNNYDSLKNKTVFAGLDVGKMNDQSILYLGETSRPVNDLDKYDDLFVRYREEFELKTDYDVIVNRLLEIREDLKSRGQQLVVGYDATGQKTFGDLAKRMGLSTVPVDFSRKETNKTLLYNDFKLMVENRKIKVVYSSKAEKQLGDLMFTLTESKKLKKVEAKHEHIHDDDPDALAILVHVAVKPSKVPVSATFVKRKNDKGSDNGFGQKSSRELAEEQAIRQNRPDVYGQQDIFGGMM